MLGVHAVKINPLSITKGAFFEKSHKKNPFPLLTMDQYAIQAVEVLERLAPSIVIQRLVGGGRPEVHVAPAWVMKASTALLCIETIMKNRKSYQGIRYTAP